MSAGTDSQPPADAVAGPGESAAMVELPPAIRSYFFGKGFRDLWATIATAFAANFAAAGAAFGAGGQAIDRGDAEDWLEGIFRFGWAAALAVFGTAFVTVLSLLHLLGLALVLAAVYATFSVVFLAERAWMLAHGFVTRCPHAECRGAPLPVYLCPGCGSQHPRLVPNEFGTFHHVCRTCGTKLPATFFNGRGALASRCHSCGRPLAREHTETRTFAVALAAGPSAGKTAYTVALLTELLERAWPARGLRTRFLSPAEQQEYEHARELFAQGTPPAKTVDPLRQALDLHVTSGTDAATLYLFDVAGEAFDSEERLGEAGFHEYLSGLLFLVDPFALPAVRARHADVLAAGGAGLAASESLPLDTLGRILNTLEQTFGLAPGAKWPHGVAVVLTKMDAFGAALARTPARELLERWDQQALLRQLERRFARVGFFACSALGRTPGPRAGAFEPRGVREPLEWLLEGRDRLLAPPKERP